MTHASPTPRAGSLDAYRHEVVLYRGVAVSREIAFDFAADCLEDEDELDEVLLIGSLPATDIPPLIEDEDEAKRFLLDAFIDRMQSNFDFAAA